MNSNGLIARTVRGVLGAAATAAALLAAPSAAAQDVVQESDQDTTAGTVMEEVVITGRQRSAAFDVIQERIEQAVVVDLVSAEQISKVGDSNVSLALRRLPGVTLVDGQFIYIRGLGERYSSTTLNGAYVPSPDLTRNVIPLDIFPAEIVQSLAIQKVFSPDQPAAFGGGNIDIRTRTVPERFTSQFQFGTGWNSDLGDDVVSYPGGTQDEFGTDDGTRALPGAITGAIQDFQGRFGPSEILNALRREGGNPTFADAEALNRSLATSLNRSLDINRKSADPDLGLQAAIGNKWDIDEAGRWRFGALGIADYGRQWRNRQRTNRSVQAPDLDQGVTERSINQVSITGSVSAGLEFTDDHALGMTAIFLRNSEDEAALTQRNNFNFRRADGQQLRDYRLRFEERNLEVLQFTGRHALGSETRELVPILGRLPELLDGLNVSWFYSDSTAKTDIPSEVTISAIDQVDPTTGAVQQTSIRATGSAADYRFTNLQDEVESYGWKLEQPLEFGNFRGNFNGGSSFYRKGRSYLQTQLGLGTTNQAAEPNLVGTPGSVFTNANILNPDNGFLLTIGGIGTESYLAGEIISAGFGGFDFTWNENWRLAGGARWEEYKLLSVPINPLQFDPAIGKIPLSSEQIRAGARIEDDWYPTLSLTHMRDDFWSEQFQLRFGWSQTVARADLRELSNATYIDPFTDARVRGNPALVKADLTNYDLRAEWFFTGGDNLTISAFYKDIERPIETIEGAGTDNNLSFTFINAETAELYGLEVEWLKNLDVFGRWWGDWADGFFTAGNLTWAESEITIGDSALNVTNNQRRLTQQSPYIANIQLGYDSPSGRHSGVLVFNTYGERLLFAGRNGAPDAFEQPLSSVDLVYSWFPTDALSVKLRLQNLLQEKLEVAQGGITVLEQEIGTTAKLDFTLKF